MVRQAHVKHVAIGDCWRIPLIDELDGVVPLSYVEKNLSWRR